MLNYNALNYPYPSKRNVVYGSKGMVATTAPLAAEAGLQMLKKGGNAVDAAIATAACMTVMEPTSNGLGGDAFALVWMKGELHGMNASGRSPEGIDVDKIREEFGDTMPQYGWEPVTVPGIPGAWAALSEKFGKLEFEELLQPAIDYAKNGFPVGPNTSILWSNQHKKFKKTFKKDYFKHWFDLFAPEGKAPEAGEMVTFKDHAKTLESIAKTKAESFYKGEIADKIDAFARETGGYLRKSDLEKFEVEWVKPISTDYKGYTVSEIPPNGHGIVALMALNNFENYDINQLDTETYHVMMESMKLAFIDGQRYVADPDSMKVTVDQLLSKEYAKSRFDSIGKEALMPEPGKPDAGGTIYLAATDEEGNMVSFIQSNYTGFGSGVVVPETGIALQNRGFNFYLDPEMENFLEPGKKAYHTIIPGFLSKDGQPLGPFGVMGGFMQPQGHFQVMVNMIDLGLNPQQALDAPRWQWVGEKKIQVEREFPYHITERLVEKGHEIEVVTDRTSMGRGQIILRNDQGVYTGGTEPRADGSIAAW